MKDAHLVLGSGSPRRKELLHYLVTDFTISKPDVDESVLANEAPSDYVERVCLLKLDTIRKQDEYTNANIICADTTVYLDSLILGKPRDKEELVKFLNLLSGKSHSVTTAYCISSSLDTICNSVTTQVLFREITPQMLSEYAEMDEAYDKAGGYAVQGYGSRFIKEIHGSVSNVIGLPLVELEDDLHKMGIL